MKLRVGVVGCGLIAQIAHLPYLQELSHLFEISALCDISPGLVGQLGRRFGVAGQYVDYRRLLEHDLDAVFVLTRDHAPVALAAAERGKHVFVEKPLCFNLDQADELIGSAQRNGITLMVGYMKRYDPGFEKAQELVEGMGGHGLVRLHCSVGLPTRVTHEMYDLLEATGVPEGELAQAKEENDASLLQAIGQERAPYLPAYSLLLHLWSHDINILRGAFGDPRGMNYAQVDVGSLRPGLPAVQVVAALDYGPGRSGVWETQAFVANEWWDEELAFFGEERTVRVQFPNPYLKNSPTVVHVEETAGGAFTKQEIVASYDEAYKRELRHFHDCVVNGREPLTNGKDGRQDLQFAIDIIRKSSAGTRSPG